MAKDIRAWLEGLGLARYAEAFAENEIDFDALPHLSEADLREIGLALGPRRKLMAAIAALDGQGPALPRDRRAQPAGAAERRQLTVLFVDLVGSTALAGRLDPEETRQAITAYQNLVAGIVTRFDGHVAKYMGDGVLCYFGWPRAHEDDAERAVRAALEIIRSLADVAAPGGERLAARAGIATGLVVVGDLIGEGGAAQEEAVVGETPNLAARMQALAEPGQVVVAEPTRRLLGDLFELADLGRRRLKGVAGATPAYAVLTERAAESRFEARSSGLASDMIGREHELALMLERWSQARRGEGQLVLLTGEAGIGKSRLTRALIGAVGHEPHVRISYQCSPYHTDSSLYPAIQQLTFAAAIKPGDSDDEKLDKLETVLAAERVPLIAALMGLPTETRYGPLDLSPQQQRARTLQALADQLVALSAERPVLFVLEDAHWIDASTLELLDLCLDQVAAVPVLMLITARPTFEHGFGGHPIVTKLALNRLGRDQVAAIVAEITGGKALPEDLLETITARTDGVPLFVEELTKTVLESGELRETETAFELDGPLSRLAIPASLHDSLMARLDRLQPVKEVAQMAACIGRHFDYALMARISPLDGPALEEALERLAGAELVFRRGMVPDASYTFKHALVRDAAYESLLRSRRQAIHAKLVEALEAEAKAPPELVAQHAAQAGLTEQAIELWARAGTVAMAQPAYEEAAAHLNAAIALIDRIDDPAPWRERVLELRVQLGQVQIAKYGYGSDLALATFRRAAEMIDATANSDLRMAIYYGLWIGPYLRAEHESCLALAERYIAEVDRQDAVIPRLISHRIRAATLIALGRPAEALDDLAIAFQLYRQEQSPDFASRFPQEPGVQIKCYQFLAHWQTGEIDRALAIADEASRTARELRHANTICYASLHHAALALCVRDDARLVAVTEEGQAIATEHDMTLWLSYGALHGELFRSRAGDDDALVRFQAAVDGYQADGNGLWLTLYKAEEAKEHLGRGALDRAEIVLRAAMECAARGSEHWMDAEHHRIDGLIRLARGETDAADAAFARAVQVAEDQGILPLALRAATSRARLWAGRGERAGARDLLGPVYGRFTEGFATSDLVEAKALLDELA